MPKLFVASDIHGFFTEFKESLDLAGFDPNNENHWFIGCGDYLDRGLEPMKTIQYIMSLPRKVLVRGNHEDLLMELISRGTPYSNDFSNGTAQTLADLAPFSRNIVDMCKEAYHNFKELHFSTVPYFETKNYIFVHSWIPVKCLDDLPAHYTKKRKFEFNPDWRNASSKEFVQARWGNPFEMAKQGLFPDKTVVFGHWHCSTGWAQAEGRDEFGKDAKFDPFYGDGFIAIDACTAYSRTVNVVTIEDEFLEDDNDGSN